MESPGNGNQLSLGQEFEAVFSLYVRGMLAYAREFLSTQEEAEDIVCEVFANFWEKIDTVDKANVRSYLFRSIHNKSLAYLSHLKVRSKYQEEILRDGTPAEAFDPALYVAHELQALIDMAIDKLPAQRKKVFIMNRIEKKPYAQIAEELDISPRTVDKHLQLALFSLRKELADYIYTLLFCPFIF